MNNLTDDIAGCIAEDLIGSARNAPQFRELAVSIVRDIKPDKADGVAGELQADIDSAGDCFAAIDIELVERAISRIQQLEGWIKERLDCDGSNGFFHAGRLYDSNESQIAQSIRDKK